MENIYPNWLFLELIKVMHKLNLNRIIVIDQKHEVVENINMSKLGRQIYPEQSEIKTLGKEVGSMLLKAGITKGQVFVKFCIDQEVMYHIESIIGY